MKLYAALTLLAAAALAVAFGVHLWLMGRYLPGVSTGAMFLDATPVVKLIVIACLLALIGLVVLTVIGLAMAAGSSGGSGEIEVLLAVTGGAAIVFGLLGAAYGEMNTQIAISRIGAVSFEVTAPSRAEFLLCLSLGLLCGVIGLGGAALLRTLRLRRAANPA